MSNWFKEIFTKNNIMSSKRVCGVIGFLVCIGVLIYCTLHVIQAPNLADLFLISCCGLLGVDSVTDIWKDKPKKKKFTDFEEE